MVGLKSKEHKTNNLP